MKNGKQTSGWGRIIRVVIKAALLILLLNVIFALLTPVEGLGSLSLYNSVFPGRERLPYGENPQESYSISLYNVPALFSSHVISQQKLDDEYRVIIIGDSGTWGWLLENEDTLAANINVAELMTGDGQQVVAYNLGYPIMSLTKDLMILDEAMRYSPDLIIWPVTLESFPRDKQLFAPIVQNNPQRIRPLISEYDLNLSEADPRFVDPSFLDETIIGQRRNVADLLRHQFYSLSWAATGIDQSIPEEITLRRSDFEEDKSWQNFEEPLTLTGNDLAFDALAAGAAMTGDIPLIIVNEPMYISSGINSDLRYNSFYPRWAYDQYRELMLEAAGQNNWTYIDLWDSISPKEFTDTPVHTTPEGTSRLADILVEEVRKVSEK